MTDTGVIIDQWAALDHIEGMEAGEIDGVPDFVSDADKRRLSGYRVLAAFQESKRRLYLKADPNNPNKPAEIREYGDPSVINSRIAAAVLGEDPFVAVIGADVSIPTEPEIGTAPQDPAEDDRERNEQEQEIAERIYEVAAQVWLDQANQIVDEWIADIQQAPRLEARQDWLRQWADDEQLIAAITESEQENVVPLGDGVHALGYDFVKQRPTIESFEPDSYFPVLDDAAPNEFPAKVHIAWTFVEMEGDDEVEKVRRITYELVPLDAEHPDYEPIPDPGPSPKYQNAGATEAPSQTHACLYSNGVWKLDDFDKIAQVETNGVEWEQIYNGSEYIDADRVPLGLDFIPVVHVPNTLARARHFGRAGTVRVAQLLDEIMKTDTDESLASRWAGNPLTVFKGMQPNTEAIALVPGQGINAGDNGGVDTVEMARNLREIGERIDRLLKRLSVNVQVPEGLLGRVDASDVPSGIAFVLSFTAFQQLIEMLRMARNAKYPLLLKFAQRIAIQNDAPSIAGDVNVYPAEIRFGKFMPQDQLGTAQLIAILIEADVLSQESGIAMAQAAGIPIDDIGVELAKIREGMGAEAAEIFDATGSAKHAAEFLGITDFEDPNGVDEEGGAVTDPTAPPAAQ